MNIKTNTSTVFVAFDSEGYAITFQTEDEAQEYCDTDNEMVDYQAFPPGTLFSPERSDEVYTDMNSALALLRTNLMRWMFDCFTDWTSTNAQINQAN